MRSPDEQRIALDCLRLAADRNPGTEKAVEAAEKFLAFVAGEKPAT